MRPFLCQPWPNYSKLLRWHPRAPQSIPRRIATTSAANAAPLDVPELILSPGSKHHNSLPSFLEYAKRVNLTPEKTVYIGTHYEYTAAISLMRLGFSLLRRGSSNDAGIDLIGHWLLPPLREPMRIIIQCKSRKASVTPANIRELEGSFRGIPPDWRQKDVLGLLVTTWKATKGTLDALARSRWPMGFVLITTDGIIQQFVWNQAASERGLEGVGVTLRHTPRALPSQKEAAAEHPHGPRKASKSFDASIRTAGTKKEIQLTWLGSPIFPDRSNLSEETIKLAKFIEPETASTIKEIMYNTNRWKAVKGPRGRPRTLHKAPAQRWGLVKAKRSSSDDSRDAEDTTATPLPVKKRGRPKGSKNKPKPATKPVETGKPRGRPKGSKNKPARTAEGD